MRVLDLFSGIGGFSLGLERAGFETVAFCEIEEFPRRVLAKHWPEVPCYDDIRTLTAERLAADGIAVDVICGGFPCQDVSEANVSGQGLEGVRSGLWGEYRRLIGEIRPRFAIVENVSNLLHRGLGTVLGDLAALGYDAEWHCIPASVVGAPHERDRIWIVAHPVASQWGPIIEQGHLAGPHSIFAHGQEDAGRASPIPEASWLQPWSAVADALQRVDDGVPYRLDGFNGCANAVVPQIPELIGRALLAAEAQRMAA